MTTWTTKIETFRRVSVHGIWVNPNAVDAIEYTPSGDIEYTPIRTARLHLAGGTTIDTITEPSSLDAVARMLWKPTTEEAP